MITALLTIGVFVMVTPVDPAPDNYGRTPDTVIPFRNFRQPYRRFYQVPVAYSGVGRDDEPSSMPSTVRIGFFAPLGLAPDADLGQLMLEGVMLAVEQANENGGYQDIPFELITRQDSGLWGASSNEMVAFKYEDHVLGVIGSIDGANTHVALRVALKVQMPMINTATTDPTLTETGIPWLLRCMADDRQQGYALAHHIINERGLTKLVAFRVNDRYGRTGISEFRDAARRLKHPLRAELRWNPGEQDFSIQLDRIEELDPDAIILWGNAVDTASIVKEIRRRKIHASIFGSDRMVSNAFLNEAGIAAEGVVAAASFNPSSNNSKYNTFVDDFTKRFNHPPETFAAHAYDGAKILIDAIQQAGLNYVRIRDALYELEHYEGVTGSIMFDTTLNDISPIYLAKVKNGEFDFRQVNFTTGAVAAKSSAPYMTLQQSPPTISSLEHAVKLSTDVHRIGCYLPLDDVGRAVIRGMKLAIQDDADQYPNKQSIELLIGNANGPWGSGTSELIELVLTEQVLAVIGSTERRGTHIIEMLAAKMHFPVVSLCGSDPTINQIPLPWIFCLAPNTSLVLEEDSKPRHVDQSVIDAQTELGYDAMAVLLTCIRNGASDRNLLRNALAADDWYNGMTGTFRFDSLGRRCSAEDELDMSVDNQH